MLRKGNSKFHLAEAHRTFGSRRRVFKKIRKFLVFLCVFAPLREVFLRYINAYGVLHLHSSPEAAGKGQAVGIFKIAAYGQARCQAGHLHGEFREHFL